MVITGLSLSPPPLLTGAVGTIPAAPSTDVTVGGVGRRGAVWPTGLDWLAMATAGAASDIASISPGMEATKLYYYKYHGGGL